jgi:hypothetical protein
MSDKGQDPQMCGSKRDKSCKTSVRYQELPTDESLALYTYLFVFKVFAKIKEGVFLWQNQL